MTEVILLHEIDYWFNEDGARKLNECDIEHIEDSIKGGCNQGELCQTDCSIDGEVDSIGGWWKII